MRVALFFALALSAPVPSAVLAETAPVVAEIDPDCGDDRGTDRCDAADQARMRALYGWDSAAALVAAGVQFRRFMMVDGYGRDVLGLTFERRPGASPRLIVEVPGQADLDEGSDTPTAAPLTTTLGAAQWEKVLRLTDNFEQALVSERTSNEQGSDVIAICLHSWVTVLEAGDPAKATASAAPAKLRADTEDACAAGLAMPAAFELAELAYEELEECHGLDRVTHRNRIMLLNTCAQLGGDRLAAASAAQFVEELEDLIAQDADIDLTGLFVWERRAQAAPFAAALQDARLYLGAPSATGPTKAVLQGSLHPDTQPPDDENAYRFAKIRIELAGDAGNWRIASYTIGEMQTVSYAEPATAE
jgi:hypothetical protein